MNGGNGKLFVIGGALIGIILLVSFVCTASTNFLGNGVSRTYETAALLESQRAIRDLAQNNRALIDLVQFKDWQIMLLVVAFLVILYMVARALNRTMSSVNGSFLANGLGHAQFPQSPHYVLLGPRGDQYLVNLPRQQQQQVLDDLRVKVTLLEDAVEVQRPMLGSGIGPVKWR